MPKELTHWIAAERTVPLVDSGPVKDAIHRHPHYFYLGAVVYDSPFYAAKAGGTDGFSKIADVLHGIGGRDTFAPYRHFFAGYAGGPPPEALSFICGALTHYSLDVEFHPLVNYFSGKYFSKDPKMRKLSHLRHRQFESLLDLYSYGRYIEGLQRHMSPRLGSHLQNTGRFGHTLRALSGSLRLVSEIISLFFRAAEQAVPILRMLKRHAVLQKLFYSRSLSSVLYLAGRLTGGNMEIAAATCYPLRKRKSALCNPTKALPFFASQISYVHPNTGEKLEASADELVARAAAHAAKLINGYQIALGRNRGESYLAGERGLSLEYGCDALKYPKPVHFSTDTPIGKLCRTDQNRRFRL